MKLTLILTCALGLGLPAQGQAAGNQSITIQGRVSDANGTPITGTLTQFRVQILTPTPERCVLFDETHTINLSKSAGLFSINLNNGLGTKNEPKTYSLEQALSNGSGFSVALTYCKSGSDPVLYSPALTDNRKVVISFRDPGTMSGFEEIPEMDLNPVPYSMETRSLNGFAADNFLRVAELGAPAAAPILSSANVTELQNLLAGNSTSYMSSSGASASGARLPTYAGNPSTPTTGSLWFDSTGSGALKYRDTSGVTRTVGTSGGGTITSITVGPGRLTSSASGGVVDLDLATLSPSPAGSYGSGSSVPTVNVDIYGRVTGVTLNPITGVLPTAGTDGQVLRSTSSAWGAGFVRTADIRSTSDQASIFPASSCGPGQAITWNSVSDKLVCQTVGLAAPGATVATYKIVNVDADGRVAGGSAPTTLNGMGIADGVAQDGNVPKISTGTDSPLPAGTLSGELLIATNSNKLYRYNGSVWNELSPATATGLADVLVAGGALVKSGSAATPTITLPEATSSVSGFLSSAKFTEFTDKLNDALNSAYLLVGNGSGKAAGVPASGDVALDNTGKFTVTGIRGVGVAAGTPVDGQILRYAGSTYSPGFLTMGDLRSTVTGTSALTTGCSSKQTLTWNSGTDSLMCTDIGGLDAATAFTAGTTIPAANLPATASLWQTGSSGRIYYNGGQVGIGTSSPARELDVVGWGRFSTASGDTRFDLNSAAATQSVLAFGTGTSQRWFIGKNSTAESGSNAGSDFSLLRFNDAGTYLGNALTVLRSNGNIGIGTTVPTQKLDVLGAIKGQQHIHDGSVASYRQTIFSTAGSYRWAVGINTVSDEAGSNAGANYQINRYDDAGAYLGSAMTILRSNGNVGLGNTAPTVSLDLSARTDAIRVPSGTGAEQPGQSGQPAAANGMIRYNTSTNVLEARINGAWTSLAAVGGNQSFGGNVSVGGTLTSTGAATFNGGATVTSGGLNLTNTGITNAGSITGVGSNITGTSGLTIASGGTNSNLALNSAGTGAVTLGSNNGASLSVLDGGASTVNYVTVKGAAAGAVPVIGTAGSDASINLSFAPKGAGNSVFANGSLGIGTTAPSQKLDVRGVLRLANADFVPSTTGTFLDLSLGASSGNTYAQLQGYTNGGTNPASLLLNPTSGGVAIGTTSPAIAKLKVVPSASGSGTGFVLGSGVAGATGLEVDLSSANGGYARIQGVQATGSTWGNLVLNPNAGNVGIGTTSPDGKLDVTGSAGKMVLTDDGAHLRFTRAAINYIQASTAGGELQFGVNGNADGSAAMHIRSSGNVGIGTASPNSLLHVAGKVQVSADAGVLADTAAYSSFGVTRDNTLAGIPSYIAMTKQGTRVWGQGIDGADSWQLGTQSSTSSGYGFIDGPKLSVRTNGNVGIGTTSPESTLDIVGQQMNTYYGSDATGSAFAMRKARGTSAAPAAVQAGDRLFGIYANGYQSGGSFSGNVGAIQINAAENFTSTNQGTSIDLGTTPIGGTTRATRMTVDPAGNVGIGTTSPSSPFHLRSTTGAVALVEGIGNTPHFITRHARASSTATQLNDLLGVFGSSGYTGSAYTNTAGYMAVQAAENFSGTNQGTNLTFITTPPGSAATAAAERMRIAGNGYVGIGTSSPGALLHLNAPNTVLRLEGSSYSTIEMGPTGNPTINALFFSHSDESFSVRQKNLVPFFINGAGNVGINVLSPSEKLHVVGNLRVQGSTDCTLGNGAGGTSCSSDIRLKDEVTEIDQALAKLITLRGVSFVWNDKSQSPGRQDIGVIAQDVEKVFPTAVMEDRSTHYKKVDYAVLVAPVIQAIKELHAKLESLFDSRNEQAAAIAQLKAENARLHAAEEAQARRLASVEAEAARAAKENAALKARMDRLEQSLAPRR